MSSVPVLISPARALEQFVADAVVEERHEHKLTITSHPLEFGSTITDHAFKNPIELSLLYAWGVSSNQNRTRNPNFLSDIFQRLLQLQADRNPFIVVTGKQVYESMLLETITYENDFKTENLLLIHAVCKEARIVKTTIVNIADAINQLNPNKTSPIDNTGVIVPTLAPNFNSSGFPQIP